MRTRNSVLMLALTTIMLTIVPYKEAGATPDGQCVIGSPEYTSANCGNLAGTVIEFIGATNTTCIWPTSGLTSGCTRYDYKYTSPTSNTNQINLAIPKSVMTRQTDSTADANYVGCSQLITNGTGDPTTGFFSGVYAYNVCRIAPSVTNPYFSVLVDLSSAEPLAWQQKSGTKIYGSSILGPSQPGASITSTGETLTTQKGTTITYQVSGGQVSSVGGSACTYPNVCTVLNKNQVFMCVPGSGTVPSGWAAPGYTCDVVFFVDKDPNIQVGPNSTCIKYIGGTPLSYSC